MLQPTGLAVLGALGRLSLILMPFHQSDGAGPPLASDVLVSAPARLLPVSQPLAAILSGQLLNPLKALRLKTESLREVAA